MQISRRDALMGATAAAVVAGVPGAVALHEDVGAAVEILNASSASWTG